MLTAEALFRAGRSENHGEKIRKKHTHKSYFINNCKFDGEFTTPV